MGPRITSQDAKDVDQSLPTSGASTPGFAIGDTGDENQPTGERLSPPDPHEWHQHSLGSLFLSHQLRVPMTSEGRSAVQKH